MEIQRAKLFRRTALMLAAAMLLMVTAPDTGATAIDVATCDLTPIQLPLFEGTPLPDVVASQVLATPAADTYSEAAVRDVLEQYVACINTGDPTLIWAMFSPHWFARTFADPQQHYLPAFEQMLSIPATSDATEPLALEAVEDITLLPEGRIDVTASFRSGDREWQDTLTLIYVDGQWLIDDVRLDASAN